VQRARAGGGEGDHPGCTSETRKAGDTPPTGEALPLPCAGGLAPKCFSARAEGEALSPYAPSLPALGREPERGSGGGKPPPVIPAKGSVTGWPRLQAR